MGSDLITFWALDYMEPLEVTKFVSPACHARMKAYELEALPNEIRVDDGYPSDLFSLSLFKDRYVLLTGGGDGYKHWYSFRVACVLDVVTGKWLRNPQ